MNSLKIDIKGQQQSSYINKNQMNSEHIQSKLDQNQQKIIDQRNIDSKKYFRFVNYSICNKDYQIISLLSDEQDQLINIDLDFRQPNNFLGIKRNKKKKNSSHSIINYIKSLYRFAKSVQLSSFLSFLPFKYKKETLQNKYKYISLAILNNSINLQAAIIKALEYNIPLMQIIINPQNILEQQQVRQKILKCFNVSHFINQNFVLYGDWDYHQYKDFFIYEDNNQDQNVKQIFGLDNNSGKIVFRKGRYVFAEISLQVLNKLNSNQLQQKFIEIRDHYYHMKPFQEVFGEQKKQQHFQERDESSNNDQKQFLQPNKLNSIEEQLLQDYLLHNNNIREDDQEYSDEEICSDFMKSNSKQIMTNRQFYQENLMISAKKQTQNNVFDFTIKGTYTFDSKIQEEEQKQQNEAVNYDK